MDFFNILTILIVISALFGFINEKFLKLPDTIGLMLITILFTIGVVSFGRFFPDLQAFAEALVHSMDFKTVLLDVMLSFLLFAGAMHTSFDQLKVQRYPILAFATFGVLVSTFLIGIVVYYLLPFLGFEPSFLLCLLFGALISPTDPIAVLGILKKAGAPKILETKIVGESLFNDGIGVVVFLTIFGMTFNHSGHEVGLAEVGHLLLTEVGGGLALGLLLGYVAYLMLKAIDNYNVEVMVTLAIVMGGYLLANRLHFSGPLAMVVAGLIVGHDTVRATTMSEITEMYVDKFWEMLDVFLNAILFVMIGLEMIAMNWQPVYVVIGLITIVIVLLARYVSLSLPILFFRKKLNFVPYTGVIMTWGGLRGGISIALALAIPGENPFRDLFITITYVIVIFSILVQGLTVKGLVQRLQARITEEEWRQAEASD
ncbi:MAG TPA: sodium:proton antiporter [Saprospiraceae bacterium]|nr:sodium:proton antiporter [Saprospiraceae bacterium]